MRAHKRGWQRAGASFLLTAMLVGCRTAPSPTTTGPTPMPRIPRDAARFEIDVVDDSTASFRFAEARWIRAGAQAYAVDPAHRDALVARLRIISRDSATARALVTSQVARLTSAHFLLMVRPPTPWWRSPRFWGGALLGAATGVGTAAVSR